MKQVNSKLICELIKRNTKLHDKIFKFHTYAVKREIKYDFIRYSDEELVNYLRHKNYQGIDVICAAIMCENTEILKDLWEAIEERDIVCCFCDEDFKEEVRISSKVRENPCHHMDDIIYNILNI